MFILMQVKPAESGPVANTGAVIVIGLVTLFVIIFATWSKRKP